MLTNNLVSQFHFLRPEWFWGLLPIVVLVILLLRQIKNGNAWETVCDAHLLKALITDHKQGKLFWPLILLTLCWILTVLILAGPTWSKQKQPVYRNEAARVIAVDLSPSMLATDIKPNRMTRARFKILDLLKHFQEGQTGMVAFAGEAYTVSPLTDDSNTIAAMVPALTPNIMPVTGHNITAALKKSAELLHQGHANQGEIILVTDNTPDREAITTARKLAKQGYTTSVLGVGTQQGAPIPNQRGGFIMNANHQVIISKLDVNALRKLAQAGEGIYIAISDSNADIKALTQMDLQQRLQIQAKKKKAQTELWNDYGYWFILLLLPLAWLSFRRGWFEELLR